MKTEIHVEQPVRAAVAIGVLLIFSLIVAAVVRAVLAHHAEAPEALDALEADVKETLRDAEPV